MITTQLTPTQSAILERSRAFHEAIAARAVPQSPPPERPFGVKGDYIPPKRPIAKPIEQQTPPPVIRSLFDAMIPVWPVLPEEKQPSLPIAKVERIQRIVCQFYLVTLTDMRSPRRLRSIVRPRQVAMYLSKILTDKSLPHIGRLFGGRDHATILWGIKKIGALIKVDEDLAFEVAILIEKITGQQQ